MGQLMVLNIILGIMVMELNDSNCLSSLLYFWLTKCMFSVLMSLSALTLN